MKKINIGDLVIDYRTNEHTLIETEKDIKRFDYVAPECFDVYELKRY